MNYNDIPQELKECRQWICHKDKIPKSPLYDGNARTTDPNTWGSFEQAVGAVSKYGYSGIGFVFTTNSPYCGIDIDHCINADTGELNEKAADIVNVMDSYTELSPSGTGLHIIYKGALHKEWKKKVNNALGEGVHLEMYQTERYFTVTGNAYNGCRNIAEADIMAAAVYNAHVIQGIGSKTAPKNKPLSTSYGNANRPQRLTEEHKIIELAKKNHNFESLYSGDISHYENDRSRADMAFCSILAFYTKDPNQIDSIFRSSGLMREKWDRKTGSGTYGTMTIENALKTVTGQYDPQYYKTAAKDDFSVGIGRELKNRFQIEIPEFTFDDLKFHALNNIKTAEFFAGCIGEYAAFVPENKSWLTYNGTYWKEDLNSLTMRSLAKTFIEKCIKAVPPPIPIPQDASKEEENEINKQNKIYMSYKNHYQSFTYLNNRINLIKDMEDILSRNINDFDTQPYLFNCQNGTLNLDTMQLQPHNPKDHITLIANVNYDRNACSERFIRFIDEITENDHEKARYLQKALGYSMDGLPREECFFLALGLSTRNGKGTLFNTVLNLFGDYGKTISFDTLSRKGAKDGSKPSPDIAMLNAARLIIANEPDKGIYFDEALLKQLTGGDPIATRKLYGSPFSFIPQFKIWITANNKPNVSDNSIFESDRLKLITFDRHFGENERDTSLKTTLKQEHEKSAILNWLLAGYQLYRKEGLRNYAQMNEQLKSYRQDNDIIQQYINDRLIFPENMPQKDGTTVKAIRCDYVLWCRLQHINAVSPRSFKEELMKHNIPLFTHHKQDKALCKVNDIRSIEE